jgi:hypothetical protein
MSDLILNLESKRCPHCRTRRNNMDGNCHNCGTRQFSSLNVNFHEFEEETPIRYWWAWDKNRGWVHRDHVMMPERGPNNRWFRPVLPDKNYNKHITPEQVRNAGSKTVRHVRRQKAQGSSIIAG